VNFEGLVPVLIALIYRAHAIVRKWRS